MACPGGGRFQSFGPWNKPDGAGRGRKGPPDLLSCEWFCAPLWSGQRRFWFENCVAPGQLDMSPRLGMVGGRSGLASEFESSICLLCV